nr:MAG TPA: hypothetical protein [Caudoviricetes sp.]
MKEQNNLKHLPNSKCFFYVRSQENFHRFFLWINLVEGLSSPKNRLDIKKI